MAINKYVFGGLLFMCSGFGFVLGSFYLCQGTSHSKDEPGPHEEIGSQAAAKTLVPTKHNQELVTPTNKLNNLFPRKDSDDSDTVEELKVENQKLKIRIVELEGKLSDKGEAPGNTLNQPALSTEQLSEQARNHMQQLMRKRVMEISEGQFESLEERFAKLDSSSEWSMDYQVKLENFIQKNNEKGNHYIQDLRCKSKLCRLEIASDDHPAWSSLVGELINQNWYSSLMLKKPQITESGTLIYFLPERH